MFTELPPTHTHTHTTVSSYIGDDYLQQTEAHQEQKRFCNLQDKQMANFHLKHNSVAQKY